MRTQAPDPPKQCRLALAAQRSAGSLNILSVTSAGQPIINNYVRLMTCAVHMNCMRAVPHYSAVCEYTNASM